MRLAIIIFLWVVAAVCLFTVIIVICDLVAVSRERKARIAREQAEKEKAEREARKAKAKSPAPKPAPKPAPPPTPRPSVVVLPPIVPAMPAMGWSPPMAPPVSVAANTGQPNTGTPNDVSNKTRR